MKTVIVSGGRLDREFVLSRLKKEVWDQLIAVDNGLRFLYENQIRPTWIVGDFDTAAPELVDYYRKQTDIPIRTYNPVKDSTDTQIAIELALELKVQRLRFWAARGPVSTMCWAISRV